MHKLTLLLILGGSLVCLFILPQPIFAQLMISEVLADPQAPQDQSEWVEIYNYSDKAQNLSQWKLNDFALGDNNDQLAAKQYLVITKSKQAFNAEFGEVANLMEKPLSLANSGGTLKLSLLSEPKDDLVYPAAKLSQSWEKAGPLCTDIYLTDLPTPGKTNRHDSSECYASPSQTTIQIEFSSDGQTWKPQLTALADTQIYFRAKVDGVLATNVIWSSKTKVLSNPTTFSGRDKEEITAKIPTSNGDLIATSIELNIYPRLRINEVLPDPEGSDTDKEWLEVFNQNSFSVAAQNIILKVNDRNIALTDMEEFPAGSYVVIKPKGSNFPNCTEDTSCKVSVSLTRDNIELSRVEYGQSLPGKSWSLLSNNKWDNAATPTPGAGNDESALQPKLVAISEIFPSPNAGEEEWVELHNYGDKAISIEGWELRDSGGKMPLPKQEIAAGDYAVIKNLKLTLNNSGEEISLYDASGTVIDKVAYPKTAKGLSANRIYSGRLPIDQVQLSETPTPGRENEVETEEAEEPVKSNTSAIAEASSLASATPKYIYALPSTRLSVLPKAEEKVDPGKLRWLLALGGFATTALLSLGVDVLPHAANATRRYVKWWWG